MANDPLSRRVKELSLLGPRNEGENVSTQGLIDALSEGGGGNTWPAMDQGAVDAPAAQAAPDQDSVEVPLTGLLGDAIGDSPTGMAGNSQESIDSFINKQKNISKGIPSIMADIAGEQPGMGVAPLSPGGGGKRSSGSPSPGDEFANKLESLGIPGLAGVPEAGPGGASPAGAPKEDPVVKEARIKNEADTWLNESQRLYGEIKNEGKFESNRWFQKLNLGSKIMTGMSLAALAISDALAERRGAPPRDSVSKVVDRLINQDVAEQKEQYERKIGDYKNALNLYGVYRQRGLDEKEAEQQTKMNTRDDVAANLQDKAFKHKVLIENEQTALDVKRTEDARKNAENTNALGWYNAKTARIGQEKRSGPDAKEAGKFKRQQLSFAKKDFDTAKAKVVTMLPAVIAVNGIEQAFNNVKKDPSRNNWAAYGSAISAYMSTFAKGVGGEVGVLSDQDIARWKKVFPAEISPHDTSTWNVQSIVGGDTPESAKIKMELIRKITTHSLLSQVYMVDSEDSKDKLLNLTGLNRKQLGEYSNLIRVSVGGEDSGGLTGVVKVQ